MCKMMNYDKNELFLVLKNKRDSALHGNRTRVPTLEGLCSTIIPEVPSWSSY